MKAFYKKIIEVFEKPETIERFASKQTTQPKYIDLYKAQDQFEENFELFSTNALFVDWDIDHDSTPPLATVNFYCAYEQLRDTSNRANNIDYSLRFLDYIEVIDAVLEDLETEETGKLSIKSEGFNKMDSIVDIYLLTYECALKPRKNPADKYQQGDYDKLDVKGQLVSRVEFDD